MAARPIWKGVLQLRRVRIPVRVFAATEPAAALTFHQLHGPCQTRIQQRKWCPTCDHVVLNAEIVKGFEFETGRYVLVLDAELEAVRPPSTRVIELTQFAPAATLDPAVIDRSYFIVADGPHAAEPFAVIAAAMTDTVGVGKLAIYGREYLVAVRRPPAFTTRALSLMLHTLHHADELRSVDVVVGEQMPTVGAVPLDQVRLAKQVIAACTRSLRLDDFVDEYQRDLKRLIDAKITGEEIVVPPVVDVTPVLNLREALVESLRAIKSPARRRG
jgi:DNA end-binding protein Ku